MASSKWRRDAPAPRRYDPPGAFGSTCGRGALSCVVYSVATSLRLAHELAKFGIVGAVNTVLDFGLANLLYLGLGWPAMGAKTTSVAVAATSLMLCCRT